MFICTALLLGLLNGLADQSTTSPAQENLTLCEVTAKEALAIRQQLQTAEQDQLHFEDIPRCLEIAELELSEITALRKGEKFEPQTLTGKCWLKAIEDDDQETRELIDNALRRQTRQLVRLSRMILERVRPKRNAGTVGGPPSGMKGVAAKGFITVPSEDPLHEVRKRTTGWT